MSKIIDLTGQRFGRLTVIERSGKVTKDHNICWKCICDCGNIKNIASGTLRSGNTKSCGCLRKDACEISVKKSIENPRAWKTNQSTGIKNVSYEPTQGIMCYRVSIVRNKRKYCQHFPTLQEAERAKAHVLNQYKKGVANWNSKI